MSDILNTVLINTYTLPQLKHRLSTLKTYLEQGFFGAPLPQSLQMDNPWIKSLPPDFLQSFNKDNLTEIFKETESRINNLPLLVLYLAFKADDTTQEQIGIFIRKTFNSPLLLDIKYDPRLIAGCALSGKGIFHDFSLKMKIEEKKLEILQSFKKFLR